MDKTNYIGDWGLGIGDWGLGPIPNPQSPIPNPQSPIPIIFLVYLECIFFSYLFIYLLFFYSIYLMKLFKNLLVNTSKSYYKQGLNQMVIRTREFFICRH